MTDTQVARPSMPAADSHDLIRVQGARVNNLKDVSVEIPKRRLTVFTGVSGSGKSSLVFGTIAAESRRLIDETYSTFVQVFMPTLARPDVDVLDGLTTAIIVDQERLGANPRSTLGTVTDANAMLRSLFSRLGKPYIGGPTAFSFNIPTTRASGVMTGPKGEQKIVQDAVYLGGMCAECEGRGTVSDLDLAVILDESKSLAEGAILVPGYTADGWMVATFIESGFFDPDKPIKDYSEKERHDLLYKQTVKIKAKGINVSYDGLIPKIRKSMFSKDVDSLQPHIRAFVERAAVFKTCPACGGSRLNEAARSSKINGLGIADVCAMQVTDAAEWLRGVDDKGVAPLVANLLHLFDSFVEIGLGYLSLDRPSGTLSGRRVAAHQDGPAHRVRADRRHLRLRRADDRAPSARHRADEQPAPRAARQGQHRARRRAQAGDDRDRRPRRRPRARGRHRRRHHLLRGDRRGAEGLRHPHRPSPRPAGRRSRTRSGRRPASSRSAAPTRTTSSTSTSTSRSACSAS